MHDVIYRKIIKYVSDNGRVIESISPEGKYKTENKANFDAPYKHMYIGVCMVDFSNISKEIRFAIEADNIQQAFESYDKCMQEAINELDEKLTQLQKDS